ncbi:MAG: hypothetical protein PHN19_00625 [Patescibacteria group bacterium]|nr:hypothetical protein [Patescibacteria group bacterium]
MRNFKLCIMVAILAMVVGCALEPQPSNGNGGNEGEGEGEGVEGEGEGEGEHPCVAGECEDGFVCMDGTCVPDGQEGEGETDGGVDGGEGCECDGGCEGEGGNECTEGQRQCIENAWQICESNGYWGVLNDCLEGQICNNGSCVPEPVTNPYTCAVWINERGELCGDINGLSSWTFGCMYEGVEPVCELNTYNGACVQIPDDVVNTAWPRTEDGGWLTVAGCEARDGLVITIDPAGGHFLTLP